MKHEFSLYAAAWQLHDSNITVTDSDVLHRCVHVLRITTHSIITFFNQEQYVRCQVTDISPKILRAIVLAQDQHIALRPAVTVLLPILKKEAFEEAVTVATQLGAVVIQPVITSKAQRAWAGAREQERMMRVMIAAAEQFKQYILPEIREPIALRDVSVSCGIFFDPAGQPLLQVLHALKAAQPDMIHCLIGPEGDLADEEKRLLNNFMFCALTPTILRAPQALLLGFGAIRSAMGE